MSDLTIGEVLEVFPDLTRAFHRLGGHIPVDREMIRAHARAPRRPTDAELIRMSDRWHRARAARSSPELAARRRSGSVGENPALRRIRNE